MALVTIPRNSTSDSSLSDEDLEDERREEVGDLPEVSSPAIPRNKRLLRQGSVSENFFAVKGAALILPRQTSLATKNLQIVKKFGAMCSCVVVPSVSASEQFGKHSLLGRRYFTESDLKHSLNIHKEKLRTSAASAPPSLCDSHPCPIPQSTSCSSSWASRMHLHCDLALHVMMKKHEIQFKLPPGELQIHLRAIFHLLRPQDNIKLAVRLESWVPDHRRYLVIISTTGRQDTDESIIVGCDFLTKESTTCTIGLVLPIWCDTVIRLDGDGGFHVERQKRVHTFKPVSVQAMWSALQSLHRCADVAFNNKYYEGSLYLTWTGYYTSKISSDRIHINEWCFRETYLEGRKEFLERIDPNRLPVERMIRSKLKEVMMDMDLDNCTSRQIRNALENKIEMDLRDYREYIDTEMLTVLGQMDCSSKILDYLYLGSEWNACNFEELEELGITHILNVTIEIDNFFPDHFHYKAIQLFDVEESDLLSHWNHTWRFIDEAKKSGGKCLVHCRMGISRSAATVTAYLMKEKQWDVKRALEHVKTCRSIICPNPAFRRQLDEYEGILSASAQRHNKLFRSRSENSLLEPSVNEEQDIPAIMSPETHPPPRISVPEEAVDGSTKTQDFDLNRHLLDIASLNVPKVTRPKSWSPEEGRACYKPRRDPITLEYVDSDGKNLQSDFLRTLEDSQRLTPHSANQNADARDLRKKFASGHERRHTHAAIPRDRYTEELNKDLALNEDNVFEHEGMGPCQASFPQRRTESTKRRKTPMVRASSPAAISCELKERPDMLSVQESPLHTSFVSPMNSPSYDNAKNVDISLLKSRFSDPLSEPDRNSSDDEDGAMQIKTKIPVRDIVAEIESPSDDSSVLVRLASGTNLAALKKSNSFVKGHHKTVSLPPTSIELSEAQGQCSQSDNDNKELTSRNRSYSETQVSSVKKIVTEIESRQTPETSTEEQISSSGEIERSMSMPSSRKKVTSGSPRVSVCGFVPVAELSTEIDNDVVSEQPNVEKSSFFIGEAETPASMLSEVTQSSQGDTNNNNNNNNNNNLTAEVLTISSVRSPIHGKGDYGQLGLKATDAPTAPLPNYKKQEENRIRVLSSDILNIIRKVGSQLQSFSDDDDKSTALLNKSLSKDGDISKEKSPREASTKRRGIVRQMAREIEKSVRRLSGKEGKLCDQLAKPNASNTYEKGQVILPGEIIRRLSVENVPESCNPSEETSKYDVAVISTRSPEARVRELVDKFDSPSDPLSFSHAKNKFFEDSPLDASFPESDPKVSSEGAGLFSLVSPPPYHPPQQHITSPTLYHNIAKQKLIDSSPQLRRSQSDRVSSKSQVSRGGRGFRSFRLIEKHRPPLGNFFSADSASWTLSSCNDDQRSEGITSATLQSSSSQNPTKALQKMKSTSLLGIMRSSSASALATRRDKTKRNSN